MKSGMKYHCAVPDCEARATIKVKVTTKDMEDLKHQGMFVNLYCKPHALKVWEVLRMESK